MWSGGPQWTQWALNPSAYQNVSHEQIDWAALAQQWIKMKESHTVPPPVQLQAPPPPPPPPPLPPPQQRPQEGAKEKEATPRDAEEGGEAPMEMDAKEEDEELTGATAATTSAPANPPVTSGPPPDGSGSWGNWNNWQQPQHWGPGWHGPGVGGTTGTWTGPPSHPPPNHPHPHVAPPTTGKDPPGVSVGVPPPSHSMGAHFPFPPHNATGTIYGEHNHPPSFDYNHGAEGVDHFGQVGFWGPGETGADMGPSPFIRHNRHGDWRGNRGPQGMQGRPYHDHQGRHGPSEHSDEEEDQTGGAVLDAAKRRQLPAWIREGLEKMEREKMKQLERERMMKEREEMSKKMKEQELAVRELSEKEDGAGMATIPKRSKFESDSEEEEEGPPEDVNDRSMEWRAGLAPLKRRKRSRFQDASSPGSPSPSPHDSGVNAKASAGYPNGRRKVPEVVEEDEVPRGRTTPPTMSREELMQETMLKVRRLLTEVLLEVTNEEMLLVAKEVLSKAKSKAPALQLRKTPALATLTGQLGLGMYGDSESSEEDSDYGENLKGDKYGRRKSVDPDSDSDEELKDQIRRRKQEFAQTEREIEAHLQEEEEKERERERERERRLIGEEPPVVEEAGVGDNDAKESTGEEEERQVEKETDTKHPSLQQEGHDAQKSKLLQATSDSKEAEEVVGDRKDEKPPKVKDFESRGSGTKSKTSQSSAENLNVTSHSSKKHERKKKESSRRKKKSKETSSQSESHTSHSSSSSSSVDTSSSSSSSESSSSSRSSSPSSSSDSSDSRHHSSSRKHGKMSKEVPSKDSKGRRGGGSRDVRTSRRSHSRDRSRSRARGRGGDDRKRRDSGSSRRDGGDRRRSRGRRSRTPERKDKRRGGGSEKDGSGGSRRRSSRRSSSPRKGRRSRSRSDRRRHNGGGRRSSSRSSSYVELSKKQGHSHRD